MKFKNKTIVILSQQGWSDGIYVSKHHYAIELAKRGNIVYFIGGPSQERFIKSGKIQIIKTSFDNLFVIEHELFYPLLIKFKMPWLHQILIALHIKNIIKKINRKIDVVWSFDLSNTIPLKAFKETTFKIFMPVDEPLDPVAFKAAETAQAIFSVTEEIIAKYKKYNVPQYCINHGVSEFFLNNHPSDSTNIPVKVGLSGNFLRPEIDHPVLLRILQSNPAIQFNFFGKIDYKIGSDEEVISFIKAINQLSNVTIHGSLSPHVLAERLRGVDAFLICYDINKDQSKGTNYHKLLEYLATGKVTITNNVTSYKDQPELVVMNESRDNNNCLPDIFQKVISNLKYYNTLELQQKRIRFAEKFRYDSQLEKIESLLNHN
ncbi:MAG TPA: hypothetical protein VIQ00_11740 [Chitinophagaceae bacterium]